MSLYSNTSERSEEYEPCWVNVDDDYVVWEGKWTSDTFDGAYGTITVPLKEVNIGEYDVEASITYDGCYNNRKKVEFPIHISSTSVESLNKREVTFLEFKGNIGSQRIEYSISEYHPNRIVGIYSSYGPDDVGSVELTPTQKRKIDYGERESSWCVIC